MSSPSSQEPGLAGVAAFDLAWMLGAVLVFSLALAPALYFVGWVWTAGTFWSGVIALPLGYFVFLFALCAVVSVVRVLLPRIETGVHAAGSKAHFKLHLHAALASYVTTTSVVHHIQALASARWLFYRGLGTKLGRGTTIAPGAVLREPSLVTLGRDVHVSA